MLKKALLLLAFTFLLYVLLYNIWVFGLIVYWRSHNPAATAFMANYSAKQQSTADYPALRQQWVSYDRISPHLKRAIVIAEDARFAEHEGFDWEGIEAAVKKNLKHRRIIAGGSTISQQLAKNLFLSSDKTLWRKLEEVIVTVMLESVMDKRRIFEIYLNVVEWGQGVFGAQAAAQHYFGTSAARLSTSQAATLAAVLSKPRFYDKYRVFPGLERKRRIILSRMAQAELPDSVAPEKATSSAAVGAGS